MVSQFRKRVLAAVALGVALPAVILATLGIFLTMRIERSVRYDTVRYNSYLGQQVSEAFERELMDHLRQGIGAAENAAREGQAPDGILRALEGNGAEFLGAHFVPVDELMGYSLIMVESQPLFYAAGADGHEQHLFCGLLLRNQAGDVIGVGGWWVDPRSFIASHFESVLQERLPGDPHMYGGIELTRRVSIEVLDARGTRVGRARQPADPGTARAEAMAGPFEGYSVRVAVTPDAPPVWTGRFLAVEMAFILAMTLLIIGALWFGYRYTIRQLELAQLKAGFISNVTHELKTPIAMVRLAVETLQMGRADSPEASGKFLGIIERETGRLQNLVESILDFARLEAGQTVFKFGKVEVGPLVHEAVESLRPRLDHLGFRVSEQVPPGLPRVRADAQAIRHCVSNLLDNAIKYSKERREITVSAVPRDGGVAISVADRGIGIAPADRKRIFEKFVRLENGLVHDVRGAGLGLSLVDQIIRAHKGRIEVDSTPGEGSTFSLVLPSADGMLGEAHAAADAKVAAEAGAGS